MAPEITKEIQLEIAHVLFIDIVGYSKLSVKDQHAAVEQLNQIVRASEQFQRADSAGRLLKVATGDGMALVFYTNPEAPAQCAVEISRALKEEPRLQWAATTAALLALGIIVADMAMFSRYRIRSTLAPPEKSIAVLPFDNLSSDKENAYFADGIQDEILTRLAKIADLKVISRTSTQQYQSKPGNLSEIARQLGVAHILEGSVQKAGNAVHINVQLIKAATDAHLWGESYDRELQNIFAVEGEVAKAIADQLRVKLTGQEEQVIAAKPTDNPEAYDAYLRGLAYSLKTANSPTNASAGQKYLKEAVRLDPKFAVSWALLSFVDGRGYRTVTLQPTSALREEAQ